MHGGMQRTMQRHFFRSLVNRRFRLLQDFTHPSANRDSNYKTKRLRVINTGFKPSNGFWVYEMTDRNFRVLQFPIVMVC